MQQGGAESILHNQNMFNGKQQQGWDAQDVWIQPHRQLLLPRLVAPQALAAAAELAVWRASSRLMKRAPPGRGSIVVAVCAFAGHNAVAVLLNACTASCTLSAVLLHPAVLPPLPHLHTRGGRQLRAAIECFLPHDGGLARRGGQAHDLRGAGAGAAAASRRLWCG